MANAFNQRDTQVSLFPVKSIWIALVAILLAFPALAADGAVECDAIALDDDLECYQGAIRSFIQSWIMSWKAGDVTAYLSHYEPDISPIAGLSRMEWEQQRTQRLTDSRDIVIEISLESMIAHRNGTTDVEFEQSFNSAGYSDRVRKRLILSRFQRSFLIREEITLDNLD